MPRQFLGVLRREDVLRGAYGLSLNVQVLEQGTI